MGGPYGLAKRLQEETSLGLEDSHSDRLIFYNLKDAMRVITSSSESELQAMRSGKGKGVRKRGGVVRGEDGWRE